MKEQTSRPAPTSLKRPGSALREAVTAAVGRQMLIVCTRILAAAKRPEAVSLAFGQPRSVYHQERTDVREFAAGAAANAFSGAIFRYGQNRSYRPGQFRGPVILRQQLFHHIGHEIKIHIGRFFAIKALEKSS
jgi:hypothetical protein